MALEKTDLTLGFLPLADAVTIIMAKERGFFKRFGLNVTLEKVNSWARLRDKLAIGDLDGAHLLAPMVIASVLGLEPSKEPFTTSLALNMNGNAITVSNALYASLYETDQRAMKERPITARALKSVVSARAKSGLPPLTFAMVFPFSSHNYQLRYWLAAEGIHPDRDIRIVVVPPPKVIDHMERGIIDGYCVGEPWNSAAIDAGVGTTLITSHELMGLAPEKVLGVRTRWADEYPNTHKAMISAILETSAWFQSPASREEAASILSAPEYLGMPAKRIMTALSGEGRHTAGGIIENMPDFNVFYRYAANFPWRSHAIWFISQMYRWGQIDHAVDLKDIASKAYRPEVFRDVAKSLGHIYPIIDYKNEGDQNYPWVFHEASAPMAFGPNRFIDGRKFNCQDPISYIESFEKHSLRTSISDLNQLNK